DGGPQGIAAHGQGMDLVELFQGGADAQGAVDACSPHGGKHLGRLLAQAGVAQVAMGVGEHPAMIHEKRLAADGGEALPPGARGSGGGAAQMVWVWRSEPSVAPRVSSILSLSCLLLSSVGKRMPTPWVRPPCALAGVTQATLPATG